MTWSDDVTCPPTPPIRESGRAPSIRTKPSLACSSSTKPSSGPVVGAVIERSTTATPLPTPSVSAGGDSIEGYETRVERLPNAEERGGSSSAVGGAATADSDTDSDSSSLDDFETDDDGHYASLNLFAILWLVSDDIFGGLLPLSTSFGPLGPMYSEDVPECKLPDTFPQLISGKHSFLIKS